MSHCHRRRFLETSVAAVAAGWVGLTGRASAQPAVDENKRGGEMRYGLVTYQWAKDWDLPTLIANCTQTNVLGVELRTTHAHGVEPTLTATQRDEVRKRFADSPVTLVGLGSDERFDNPDPAKVRQAIETTKRFLELSHDLGSTGVKVKPDRFWPDVPREQTIAQIAKSLNELGAYAEGFGQQVRLEVHGQCAELPTIAAIMQQADHPSVAVCWNSNPQDLQGEGLAHNFGLVKDRLGQTTHIHVLEMPEYPFAQLLELFVAIDYQGWLMLEEGKVPNDPVSELARQRLLFDNMLAVARQKAG
jgi:sugar phosphate isomerase/epimerase